MKLRRPVVAGYAALVAASLASAAPALAKRDAPRSVVYATFEDEEGAKHAFDVLRQAEKQKLIGIDSYAIVSRDRQGKIHVKDQRNKGAGTGAIIGAVVGLLGGPVGVALGAGAGGAVGYLTGDAVGMPQEAVDQIKDSLEPGESAVVAIVQERSAAEVAQELKKARARQMLQEQLRPAPQQQPESAPPAQPGPPPGSGGGR